MEKVKERVLSGGTVDWGNPFFFFYAGGVNFDMKK